MLLGGQQSELSECSAAPLRSLIARNVNQMVQNMLLYFSQKHSKMYIEKWVAKHE